MQDTHVGRFQGPVQEVADHISLRWIEPSHVAALTVWEAGKCKSCVLPKKRECLGDHLASLWPILT